MLEITEAEITSMPMDRPTVMDEYGCPGRDMPTGLRIVVIVVSTSMCFLSFIVQLPMLRATKKFAGWNSDFSFTILFAMSVVALQLYFGEFVAHVRFAFDMETGTIDTVIGASFMTSFLTDVALSVTMILHRVAYTFYPYKASRVLTSRALKVHLCVIALLHFAVLGILVSPYAGYQFCPQSLVRFIADGELTPLMKILNKISNYITGFAGLIAYITICTHLYLRGSLKFSSNAEHRLTYQVVAMSTIGLLYFLYWEFSDYLPIPEPSSSLVYEAVSLLYFNAEFAPYLLLNKTFRKEFFLFFRRKKPPAISIKVSRLPDIKTHLSHTDSR